MNTVRSAQFYFLKMSIFVFSDFRVIILSFLLVLLMSAWDFCVHSMRSYWWLLFVSFVIDELKVLVQFSRLLNILTLLFRRLFRSFIIYFWCISLHLFSQFLNFILFKFWINSDIRYVFRSTQCLDIMLRLLLFYWYVLICLFLLSFSGLNKGGHILL